MKSIFKVAAVILLLFAVSTSEAQVSVEVGVGYPRRELIIRRPYPHAIWVPGYYHWVGRRYLWAPGYWRRPHYWVAPRRHYIWHEKKHWHRNLDRGRYYDNFHDGRIR